MEPLFPPQPKSKAYRSEAYLDFIRKQPCIFGHGAGEPHHVGLGRRGTGIKAPDSHSVSLCRDCHDKSENIPGVKLIIMDNIMAFIEHHRNVDALMLTIDFLTEYMGKEGL